METQVFYNLDYVFPEYISKLIAIFVKQGYEIYLVGGSVRDIIMDRPNNDFDFSTSANYEQITKLLSENHIEFDESYRFLNYVVAKIDGNDIDISQFHGDSLYQDLHDRDFSMNAMAYDPSRKIIIDYFDGKKDIENKVIKILTDDYPIKKPKVFLRAIRFCLEFGFTLDKHTQERLTANVEALESLRSSSLKNEMLKILKYL